MNLNDKQLEAVNCLEGPCLVLAGAGSGKTKVLTERMVNLINNGVDPENILAITFTNKAAKEMKNRVVNKIGNKANKIFIGTFHSFGLKIIRENYQELGFNKNITIIDSDDSLTIIKKFLKELDLDTKIYNPHYIKNKISFAKNEMLSPLEYEKLVFTNYDKKIAEIYKKYTDIISKNNSVDFDDLLILPIKLFKQNNKILNEYQEHFKYLLVDEYQDTNKIQYQMCKLISQKYNNIFVVGDIDQNIYAWRFANVENIMNFEKEYKNCKTILLEQNYRSTKNILNAANQVIQNNKARKEKKLWSSLEEGNKIKYLRSYDEKHEIALVVEEIKKLKKDGMDYKNIAVLYRTNAQSRVAEEKFLMENIPYKIVGSYYFYNRKEIKDLISYLKLIYNPNDGICLTRAINTPKRGIGPTTVKRIVEKAKTENKSMFEAIESGKELEFKNTIIDLIEDSKKCTLTELIDKVLEKSGIKESLIIDKTLESDIRLENLEEFKSITKSFEQKNGEIDLQEFLESISLVSDAGLYKEETDSVTLMTLHSAKGLEFDVVFIIGLEENLFPHSNSSNSDSEIEEERRLCYVGITRAKRMLYITNCKRRMLFGKDMVNAPSRFIKEIDDSLIEKNSLVEKTYNKKDMFVNTINENLIPGDKIQHDKYGVGVVISIDKSLAKIAFGHEVGIKTLIKTHKSIKKI